MTHSTLHLMRALATAQESEPVDNAKLEHRCMNTRARTHTHTHAHKHILPLLHITWHGHCTHTPQNHFIILNQINQLTGTHIYLRKTQQESQIDRQQTRYRQNPLYATHRNARYLRQTYIFCKLRVHFIRSKTCACRKKKSLLTNAVDEHVAG